LNITDYHTSIKNIYQVISEIYEEVVADRLFKIIHEPEKVVHLPKLPVGEANHAKY